MKREVPNEIQEHFINWVKDLLGIDIVVAKERHGDEGVVYKINSKKGNYYLKIKAGSTFLKERERLIWFQNKLPVPNVVGFIEKNNIGAILLTALEGKNLAVLCKEWPVEKVIKKLVEVLRVFHNTDKKDWPFDEMDNNKILVHGDACLPNFIFNGDQFSGYIDLADSRLAAPEVDLAATIWSLQYNLGMGHGLNFLKEYGCANATEDAVKKLYFQYVEYQKEQGFL